MRSELGIIVNDTFGEAGETAVRALFRLDSLFLSHQGERKYNRKIPFVN